MRTRTPLLALLEKAFKAAVQKNEQSADEADFQASRRNFIRHSTAAILAAGMGSLSAGCFGKSKSDIQVAIVGGGMAGLNAAYQLQKAGIRATVYEASGRVGGRIYSLPNLMGPDLTTELGGEFIDSNHQDMLRLCSEFGLSLYDSAVPEEEKLKNAIFIDGKSYTFEEVVDALQPIAPKMMEDIDSLPANITYQKPGNAKRLDELSISRYLEQIGASPFIQKLFEISFTTEYGIDASAQSSINMLFLLKFPKEGSKYGYEWLSDERFRVKGGNQQIPDKIAARLTGQIKTGYKLVKVKAIDQKYELTFEYNGAQVSVAPDFVVMAIPFTLLREVDLKDSNFSDVKLQCIRELGYGTNAKLFLGFTQRYWRQLGYVGAVTTDNGMQSGYDHTQLQPGEQGGYTIFTGGKTGVELGEKTPEEQAEIMLNHLEQVFSGIKSKYNGNVFRFHWPTNPLSKASYMCFLPGQWTRFSGAQIEPVRTMFFAGEHCSYEFQGFMNGAAETGRLAALAILKHI